MTHPLALTLGEPAGIGPDISLAAWLRREACALPPFYVIGDIAFLHARARAARTRRCRSRKIAPDKAAAAFGAALPVVDAGHRRDGRRRAVPTTSSAPIAIASIRNAVADVVAGRAAAVVTNPIAKSVLYKAGFSHPGHTEFLAELAADRGGNAPRPVMMLWSPTLAVIPVTIHLPLRDAIAQLTVRDIVETGTIAARDLKNRFGIAHPRIAVSGLNPHAGEDGALGKEDDRDRRARRRRCAPQASTRAGRCPPTPCSMKPRARPMTARSACITIRR